MINNQNTNPFANLENRTLKFAKKTRLFVSKLPRTIGNIEDGKQFIRSSGSIGANYIEANESVSQKDFLFRMRITRKETKETQYWLELIDVGNNEALEKERQQLLNEVIELIKIIGSIIEKSK